MKKLPLLAKENNWRLFMLRKADPAFLAFQKRVFTRDQYSCQFCGFQATEFIEVVNLDNNYSNNRLSNLATACPFCAQCLFLDGVGKSDFGGGVLIYMPEISQGQLNALCHVLFARRISGQKEEDSTTRNLYRSLRLRNQWVDKEIGEGLSNPALMGQLLIETESKDKARLKRHLLEKVRLLPDFNSFALQLETWMVKGLQALQ